MLPGVDKGPEWLALKAAMRETREGKRVSQASVAPQCGVDQPQVSRWENPAENQYPDFEQLARYEDAVGVPRGYLLAKVGFVAADAVEVAVAASPHLDEAGRQELLAAYRTVKRQAGRRTRK